MENVLAVKTEFLAPFLTRNGCITNGCAEAVHTILTQHVFLPRNTAEADPGYRQIIPYVVIRRGGEFFATRRLRKGGESRLHGKLSIGIGGHINPESDGDGSDVLQRGMRRELHEEVIFSSPVGDVRFLGLINDASNSVGCVHLGLLCILDTQDVVAVRETEKLEGFWMTPQALHAQWDALETWTQIALCALEEADI